MGTAALVQVRDSFCLYHFYNGDHERCLGNS